MARRFEVTGDRSYRGHAPGETFEADLTEAQEARAIERGSIKRARQERRAETPPAPPVPAFPEWGGPGQSTPGPRADDTKE